jgi:RNA polymerase sigma factor (sigma-70 family)
MADPSSSTPATRWTLIVRAQGEGREARLALDELIRRYRRTILAHIRHWRCPPGVPPDDVIQNYLTDLCRRDERRNDIGSLDPKHGKFRAWLRRSVRNHMRNTWNHWKAERYGNRITDYPEHLDLAHDETPEDLCMAAEALDVCDAALNLHREQTRNVARFDRLKGFLPSRHLAFETRKNLANALGITVNHLNVDLMRIRDRHHEILCRVVADGLNLESVTDPMTHPAVLRELWELREALWRSPERSPQL